MKLVVTALRQEAAFPSAAQSLLKRSQCWRDVRTLDQVWWDQHSLHTQMHPYPGKPSYQVEFGVLYQFLSALES